ncbi:MAG: 4Fe-4S dicluster domain-containing protein [Bacteroidales bacterium]|nr:4Fe-4S dicluster domain-containing protein [Bacteroidales bacterium]
MGVLVDTLKADIRIEEGLKACINCGSCVATCPAAEFYSYSPKNIVNLVSSWDEDTIKELLCSETIWYCGECMSCMTRCPRGNAPGMVIMALRSLSIKEGYFLKSERGRQQLRLQRALCGNILNYGYCVYPRTYHYEEHPESGSIGKWVNENADEVFGRVGANLDGSGTGVLRKISDKALAELKSIFDATGATEQMERVEQLCRENGIE